MLARHPGVQRWTQKDDTMTPFGPTLESTIMFFVGLPFLIGLWVLAGCALILLWRLAQHILGIRPMEGLNPPRGIGASMWYARMAAEQRLREEHHHQPWQDDQLDSTSRPDA